MLIFAFCFVKIRRVSLVSTLVILMSSGLIGINSSKAFAKGYCKVQQQTRTLFSEPIENIDQKIDGAMKSAKLKGKVEKIVWAKGLQAYHIYQHQSQVFAPSADLFPVEYSENNEYQLEEKKIGSHYKVGSSPAWEFSNGDRLIGEKIKKIDGAGEKDAPWLVVKTNLEDYYILRIETRGGILPRHHCNFEGILGVPYQTLYVIVKKAQ